VSGFERRFPGKKGEQPRVEPVFIQGTPDFQIASQDIAQAAVGSPTATHFDKYLGNISALDPLNLEQAHHQVGVRGNSESQIETPVSS
jgi:hypothetical protein